VAFALSVSPVSKHEQYQLIHLQLSERGCGTLNLVRMEVAEYIPYIYRNLFGGMGMGADD
jgi:hypothetical protein